MRNWFFLLLLVVFGCGGSPPVPTATSNRSLTVDSTPSGVNPGWGEFGYSVRKFGDVLRGNGFTVSKTDEMSLSAKKKVGGLECTVTARNAETGFLQECRINVTGSDLAMRLESPEDVFTTPLEMLFGFGSRFATLPKQIGSIKIEHTSDLPARLMTVKAVVDLQKNDHLAIGIPARDWLEQNGFRVAFRPIDSGGLRVFRGEGPIRIDVVTDWSGGVTAFEMTGRRDNTKEVRRWVLQLFPDSEKEEFVKKWNENVDGPKAECEFEVGGKIIKTVFQDGSFFATVRPSPVDNALQP